MCFLRPFGGIMKRMMYLAVAMSIVSAVGLSAVQQQSRTRLLHPGFGGSPHVLTEWVLDEAVITIQYGRPYLKGRTIGQDIVPYSEVWRVGADEATTLTSDADLVFGDLTVPAGSHTIW